MHRHRGFRHHGPRHFHRWGFFPGFFWPLGLAFLLFGGHWWPAILILIGLSVIFGSLFHDERPMEQHNPPPPFYDARPMTPPPAPRVDPAPVQQIHRADLLPLTCSQCGGTDSFLRSEVDGRTECRLSLLWVKFEDEEGVIFTTPMQT